MPLTTTILLADHGDLGLALIFVAPVLLIVAALLVIVVRDRRRDR